MQSSPLLAVPMSTKNGTVDKLRKPRQILVIGKNRIDMWMVVSIYFYFDEK